MCTIAILVGVTDVPVVVAANRDELYDRPTRGPAVLGAGPGGAVIVGGTDERSGGTWLALRSDGAFAAVTNQRALAPPPAGALRSRGLAVRELVASAEPSAFAAAIDPRAYASMNLVWGDARGASVGYFRHDTGAREIQPLAAGVHVLCNDVLGSTEFPRGDRLRAGIAAALAIDTRWATLAPRLAALLADHTRVAPPASHLPPDLARELTATCIHSPAYGTRSATLAALDTGAVRAYLHADGAPCTAPFVDHTELLA